MKRVRPENYVPWKKEPQYLFDAPEHRQRAELTAAQFGIAPSALPAPVSAPPPSPLPPKRTWTYNEKGQGGLFNMSRGRRNRSGEDARVSLEYGVKKVPGGWHPVYWHNGREHYNWTPYAHDRDMALRMAKAEADERAARYIGDWIVTVKERR